MTSARRYVHVTIKPEERDRIKEFETELDKASDWYRYAPNSWVVVTSKPIETWYNRLRPYLDNDDSMLICEFDPGSCQGWMSQKFWDWLNKSRKTHPPLKSISSAD